MPRMLLRYGPEMLRECCHDTEQARRYEAEDVSPSIPALMRADIHFGR